MSFRFILSVAIIILCCLVSVHSFQLISYKVKSPTNSYSTDRLSIKNVRLYRPESKFCGKLFAQPDRKITRDSEDEYFESEVRKQHL